VSVEGSGDDSVENKCLYMTRCMSKCFTGVHGGVHPFYRLERYRFLQND